MNFGVKCIASEGVTTDVRAREAGREKNVVRAKDWNQQLEKS